MAYRSNLLRAGFILLAAASSAFAESKTGTPSPADLHWLRGEVGDGALVHHADGRIYLTELATGETVHVGNGDQPEFSPDGTRFAWIDGRTARGRLRKRDTTVHVIASGVERSGGVHWLSDNEVALVLRSGRDRRWFRVSLSGEKAEIPQLTALGTGGYEADIRLGDDGVWSYVADESWATSDGRRGRVAGTCSVSLSPDGRSVTSLHDGHKRLSIQSIRPGGEEQTLTSAFKFDNHRWASNNPRYIVAVDETDQRSRNVTYPIVMLADGSRSTRMGNKGFAAHGVYGDFVVGSGTGGSWPARSVLEPVADKSLSGIWEMDVRLRDGGGTATIELSENKDGTLTGVYSGSLGKAAITGSVQGADVQFSFHSREGKVTYKGKHDGGRLSGTCNYGRMGKGTFEGAKV